VKSSLIIELDKLLKNMLKLVWIYQKEYVFAKPQSFPVFKFKEPYNERKERDK